MPTKPSALKKLDNLKEGGEGLSVAYGSIYFIFFSHLTDALKDIFATLGNYFQTAGFVLSGILFLLNVIRFAIAPNKNIGEVTENLFLGAVQLTLLGLATFGVLTFGAVAVGVLFTASSAIDMLINLGKSIYFAIRSVTDPDPGQRMLYREEAIDASTKLIVIGIAVIILTLAVMAPHIIGISVIATLSMVTGVFLAGVGIAAIAKAVYKTFFEKEKDVVVEETKVEDKLASPTPPLDTSFDKTSELVHQEEKKLGGEESHSTYSEVVSKLDPDATTSEVSPPSVSPPPPVPVSEPPKTHFLSFFWDYYRHSMVKLTYSPEEVLESIQVQKKKLVEEVFRDSAVTEEEENKSPHAEEEKRINKNRALILLEQLVEKIKNGEVFSDGGKINFDLSDIGANESDEEEIPSIEVDKDEIPPIEYETPLELKEKFNNYIVKKFPGVFQSFFYDVGKTEQLFAQAYQLLKDSRYVKPRPVETGEGESEKHGPAQK